MQYTHVTQRLFLFLLWPNYEFWLSEFGCTFFSLSSISNNECLLKWLLVIEGIGYYHTYALKNTLFQIERVPDFTLNVHTYIGSTYLFGIHQTFLNMNKVSTIICIYCSYRYLASDLKKVCTVLYGTEPAITEHLRVSILCDFLAENGAVVDWSQ